MRSARGAESDEAQNWGHKRRLPNAATAKLVTEKTEAQHAGANDGVSESAASQTT
jgi:hypothetical protein